MHPHHAPPLVRAWAAASAALPCAHPLPVTCAVALQRAEPQPPAAGGGHARGGAAGPAGAAGRRGARGQARRRAGGGARPCPCPPKLPSPARRPAHSLPLRRRPPQFPSPPARAPAAVAGGGAPPPPVVGRRRRPPRQLPLLRAPRGKDRAPRPFSALRNQPPACGAGRRGRPSARRRRQSPQERRQPRELRRRGGATARSRRRRERAEQP